MSPSTPDTSLETRFERPFPAAQGTVSIVATLTEPLAASATRPLAEVDCVEVRADLAGDLDPDRLRVELRAEGFTGRLLYTLRSREEGGRFEGGLGERHRRIRAAAERYDLVDLEDERDHDAELLGALPPERRVLSWHGGLGEGERPGGIELTELAQRASRMLEIPARLYKLVPSAASAADALVPLQLLERLGRSDVLAFATGEAGVYSRLLAPRLGARVAFGSLAGSPAAPGQLSVERLRRDFGFPALPSIDRLFGIVGHPVSHSLSPRLHNGAYRELGVRAFYLPFDAVEFGDFWVDVAESELLTGELRIAGLSVTTPHKRSASVVAAVTSPLAERCRSSNTLICREGVWEAHTTDADGVLAPLVAAGFEVAGRRAAVVGCGGAGRAAAVGLALAGAQLVVVNRGEARGRQLATELGVDFVPLAELDPGAFDVLVNATALGSRAEDEPPWDPRRQRAGAAVVEMNYAAGTTRLVEESRRGGCLAVGGREVLVRQALRQFTLMTGVELPYEVALAVLDGGEGTEASS